MRFFIVSFVTYIVLSLVGAKLIMWKAGPNPDGFGPGLGIFALMVYVNPVMSLVVGGIDSIVGKRKSTNDAENSDDRDGPHDGPRFNECG